LTEYDKLLKDAREKVEAFKSTAKIHIPKMHHALRNENLKPEDARDRIEKDCINIWSKRTILDALPDGAKDLEKQKAGRLSQKEANSAAVSAAPLSTKKKKEEEIMIDTEGRPIEDNVSPSTRTLMSDSGSPSSSGNSDGQLQNNDDDDLLDFELSLPLKDVWRYMIARPEERQSKDDFWVNGTLDKRTGKVISAAIGRISQLE
jgi:hypothetical protein